MRTLTLATFMTLAASLPAVAHELPTGASCAPVGNDNVAPPVDFLAYIQADHVRFPRVSHLACAVSNGRILECKSDSVYLEKLAMALVGRTLTGINGKPECISITLRLAD